MKYIAAIKELETFSGHVFKNIYYDGDLVGFYGILNAKEPPRFMYFIPMNVTEDNDEDFESIIIKTDDISCIDVTEQVVETKDDRINAKEDTDGDYHVPANNAAADYDIDIKNSKKFFADSKEYIDILDTLLAELKKHE